MQRRSVDACLASAWPVKPQDLLYWLNDALLFADVAAGALIGYLSVELYIGLSNTAQGATASGILIWRELILTSVITALVLRKADYTPGNEKLDLWPALLGVGGRALCTGTILFTVGLVTGTMQDMARAWIAMWALLFLAWLAGSRLALMVFQRRLAHHGALRESIAVISAESNEGCGSKALVDRLKLKADVVSVADRSVGGDASFQAALTNIVSLAQDGAIGLVVLASETGTVSEETANAFKQLMIAPVQIAICMSSSAIGNLQTATRMVGGIPMRMVSSRPVNRHDLLAKEAIDKFGAVLLIALASPLLAAVAVAIIFESEGPVIFRQTRTGRFGRPFTVYKFRTMQHTADRASTQQTCRNDPRCTGVGSILRKMSLDEMPQLWNVLRGDMSLVGPRPHADTLHARERTEDNLLAEYAQRQRVKPGLTGWAQVHGLRGAADTPEKLRRRVEMDLYYIEHWTLWLDLTILARTPWAILSTENAF